MSHAWNLHTTAGLSALNAEITRQATMISYVDVFVLLMVLTIALMPLLLLLKDTRGMPESGGAHASLD